jgi:DNA-binding ferritin-like protein
MKNRSKRYRNILTGRPPTRKRNLKGGRRSDAHGSAAQAIVPTFLHMLNTVKLYHWKTTSFSTHKATDELYGTLNEKIDDFVEVMLGKREMGGRAKLLNVHLIKLTMYSNNEAFKKQVESYKDFLIDLNKSLGMDSNADLLAIRDEILAAFNKFLYLLSLS